MNHRTHRATRLTIPVAACLGLGVTGALVATLVALPGADESATTGALLLSFGAGWAALAVLARRGRDRALRWPWVAAAVMGTSGLALLATAPGQQTMAALSWVWPPAVLALAVWVLVRVRRDVTGLGRWLLVAVLAVLVLTTIGATAENVILVRDANRYPAPGVQVEVDGRTLHLDCHGTGGPTVILLNGLGEISSSWGRVSGPVSRTTRVCAYDRAGQAWSDDAPEPQDGAEAATDLHAVLAEAGEEGPFVLVGHSIGGLYAMTYAGHYPEQVAGMVLLDSTSPRQFELVPAYPRQYAAMRRGYALLTTLARMGTGHLVAGTTQSGAAGDRVRALTSTPRAARNARDDLSMLPATMREADRLRSLTDRPLVVLSASESLEHDGWRDAQDEMAALSDGSVHRTATSSHVGLLDDEEASRESVRAVVDTVTAVRTGRPLSAR